MRETVYRWIFLWREADCYFVSIDQIILVLAYRFWTSYFLFLRAREIGWRHGFYFPAASSFLLLVVVFPRRAAFGSPCFIIRFLFTSLSVGGRHFPFWYFFFGRHRHRSLLPSNPFVACIHPHFCHHFSVLLDHFEFCSILFNFTGFYWVLLGFTGFYWVLLDFSGFSWL